MEVKSMGNENEEALEDQEGYKERFKELNIKNIVGRDSPMDGTNKFPQGFGKRQWRRQQSKSKRFQEGGEVNRSRDWDIIKVVEDIYYGILRIVANEERSREEV